MTRNVLLALFISLPINYLYGQSDTVRFMVGIHGSGEESNYVVSTDNDILIDQCRAQLELLEEERLSHINGFLDHGDGGFNQPWNWHIIHNEWALADMSIGVCNAAPEEIENDLDYWVNTVGQLCNWGSFIKEEIGGELEAFWLSVDDGYSSGLYMPNDTIHIWSDLDPLTMTFKGWNGDTSLLDDPKEWHTRFLMPNNDVQFYALDDSTGPIEFEYEMIQGAENFKNVYYKFPDSAIGTILFFHGGSGNAEDIIQRLEVTQFFHNAFEQGYGLMITESEDQTLGDLNGDGKTPWLLSPWTVDGNIDIANIQTLIDTFTVRGYIVPQTPMYASGVSNGGNFSSIVAHSLNFNASAMYSSQGNPLELYQVTETPTIFCPAKYDPALGGGNWAAQMNFNILQARDIPSAFYELDRSPAYEQRFARIPEVNNSLSGDIFNEFLSMQFIDNDHYFSVLSDSIKYLYMTSPDTFSVLNTLSVPTIRHVLDQVKVMTADHSFFSDYNHRVLSFFSEHISGPKFWQKEEIPQGYKYQIGSSTGGHVMVAGTDPNDGTPALFYSQDEGISWAPMSGLNNPAPMFQDVILSGDGRIYIPDFAYGVFYSDDYGQTWTGVGDFTPEGCSAFGLHSSGILFAGLTYTGIGYIHRSTNNGLTWDPISLPDYNSNYAVEHIHFNSQGHVFLGTINGVYRSMDIGLSWEQLNSGLNGVHVYSMAIDNQDHIYVLTTQPGLFDGYYLSTDNGNTWEALDWVQDIGYALDIVAVDDHIYAVNDQTIFVTIDGAQNWSELTDGINAEETYNLGADLELTPSGFLYAGGRYVHRSSQPVFSTTMDIKPIEMPREHSLILLPAYPNPFNPVTTIRYELPKEDLVNIIIYDMTGRAIKTLINRSQTAGYKSIQWDATNNLGHPVSAGMYIYSIQAGEFRQTRKMVLLK